MKTTYIVLRQIKLNAPDAAIDWREENRAEASSADHAIRQHGQPGTFVAIPARSFTPRTVTVETVSRVIVTDNTPKNKPSE